jgi:serine/threonine protein kinase
VAVTILILGTRSTRKSHEGETHSLAQTNKQTKKGIFRWRNKRECRLQKSLMDCAGVILDIT